MTENKAYDPVRRRVGEPSPQTDPDRFSTADLKAEARHLRRLQKAHGWHPLRAEVITRLAKEIRHRESVPERSDIDRTTVATDRASAWEDVRAPTLRVGDVTPAGPIVDLEHFGSVGVSLTLADGRLFHRGVDDIVTRRGETPINRTGEVLGLSDVLAMTEAWEHETGQAISQLETAIAAMEGAEIGPEVTGPFTTAMQALTTAHDAFASALAGLRGSVSVGEAYGAAPGAGDKQFLTS